MTSRKGFTLIELLIVVAIIGILAAIAIPNFLQAQTRAKVARVLAEVRTLSSGLELYYVDNNDYPLNWYDTLAHPSWHGGMHPNLRVGMHYSRLCLWLLTTPIDYLSTVDYDEPFPHYTRYNPGYWYAHTDGGLYWYQPYKWGLISRGPDHTFHEDWRVMPGFPSGNFVEYDPTNGTVSKGNITKYGP